MLKLIMKALGARFEFFPGSSGENWASAEVKTMRFGKALTFSRSDFKRNQPGDVTYAVVSRGFVASVDPRKDSAYFEFGPVGSAYKNTAFVAVGDTMGYGGTSWYPIVERRLAGVLVRLTSLAMIEEELRRRRPDGRGGREQTPYEKIVGAYKETFEKTREHVEATRKEGTNSPGGDA